MKDEAAEEIMAGLKEAGVDVTIVMADSEFYVVQNLVTEDDSMETIHVSNEGIGVAIAAGAWAGGKKPALLIPTAGLLVAAWPLTSLCMASDIPVLMLIPYRGDLGDEYWYMRPYAYTTEPLLDVLQVPYQTVSEIPDIKEAITGTQASTTAYLKPGAVLLTGETIW